MRQMNQRHLSQILSICSIERPSVAPARLVDSQPSIQEPQCRASPPTSKYFPSAPRGAGVCAVHRVARWSAQAVVAAKHEQAAALAEKQNESPSRTDDEADLVARLESGTASSSDSQNSQNSGDGSESTATNTNATLPPQIVPPPPSTRWKTPISTAPAAYISAAFPTTAAIPTLPSRRQHAPARHAVVHARRV